MRTRLWLAIGAIITLAGCSGAGGGLGAGNGAIPPPPTSQTLSQQEVAQAGAEAAFSPIESGQEDAGLFNGAYGTAVSNSIKPLASLSTTGSCNNGREFTVTVISPTQTQYELKLFYDNACTELARDAVALVTKASSSSETIARTVTNYNLSGIVLSTRKTNFAVTGSSGNFSAIATGSLFIGTSTSPEAQSGRQLTVAPQNATTSTISGNSGHIENVGIPSINESFGHSGVLQNTTETTDASGNVTFAGTHVGTFVKGPLGSLSLPANPPFAVSGGTQIGQATISGSVEFDSNDQLINVTLNGTLLNGNTLAVTTSGTPPTIAINGVITSPSNQPVATFTVDKFGNGVITYASGQQALIVDWHVVK
jgi:hypothetical protein